MRSSLPPLCIALLGWDEEGAAASRCMGGRAMDDRSDLSPDFFGPIREPEIQALARTELPAPADMADVLDAFEAWIDVNLPGVCPHLVMLTPFGRPSLTMRERAVVDLLGLLFQAAEHWFPGLECGGLEGQLDRIASELDPVPAVMLFLKSKTPSFLATGIDALRAKPDRLVGFLVGALLEESADTIVLPRLGANVAFAEIIPAVAGDAFALLRLRGALREKGGSFDRAMLDHRDRLTPALESAMRRLFDPYLPSPVEYLDAFAPMLREECWVPDILAQVANRSQLRSGFTGTSAEEWLRVLAEVRTWTPDLMRVLVRSELLFAGNPEAFCPTAVAAAGAVERAEPSTTVFGALCLLRLVRRHLAENCRIADVELEERARGMVGELRLGPDILAVHDRLGSLPLGVGRSPRPWTYLGNAEKGLWRWRVRSSVEGRPALCEGLSEFLLATTSLDVYADVASLIEDLLSHDKEMGFLHRLARSKDELVSLRAGCLAREIPFNLPTSVRC